MIDWLLSVVEEGSALAVGLLMFLENLFPPIPSEVVMPLAGFVASQGEMSLVLAIVAGFVGSLAGAVFWYFIGEWLGVERLKRWAARYGRWLALAPDEIDKADRWFDRHGGKAVFLGRLVPGVRTLISVPAGIADMSFRRFLAYTALGTGVWTMLLAAAGVWLGANYERVAGWLEPVSLAVVAAILIWYLWRVATFGRRVRASGHNDAAHSPK